MNCTYCGTRNSEDDHRCSRCGRRLGLENAPGSPRPVPAIHGSVAPCLDQRQAVPEEVVREATTMARPPRQRKLFSESVLKFEDYASASVPKPRSPVRARKRPSRRVSRRLERLEKAGQQRLEFDLPAAPVREETTSGVRSVRYCTDRVARPSLRIVSTVMDTGVIAAGVGLFFGLFQVIEGTAALASLGFPVTAASVAGIFILYRTLWWLANGDTPGLRWCGLRLRSFTGQKPARRQRAQRIAGAILGLAAGGLGILWVLMDEEHLGWSDHVSRTFPSPIDS